MSKTEDIQKVLTEHVISGLSFIEALYTGKRYIRCPYNNLSKRRTGYAEFDTQVDALHELTTLHDSEFVGSDWQASDTEGFEDHEHQQFR